MKTFHCLSLLVLFNAECGLISKQLAAFHTVIVTLPSLSPATYNTAVHIRQRLSTEHLLSFRKDLHSYLGLETAYSVRDLV
jgi:hypothetical protein